jgi:hypothetical protein
MFQGNVGSKSGITEMSECWMEKAKDGTNTQTGWYSFAASDIPLNQVNQFKYVDKIEKWLWLAGNQMEHETSKVCMYKTRKIIHERKGQTWKQWIWSVEQ